MSGAALDPFGLVGQVLEGQYRVDSVVGEGGCGVVYQGWHIAFEQPIAIKALKVPDVTNAETRITVLTKFREEAKLSYVLSQASLSIVRSVGYGAVVTPSQAWAPYLVLEWLKGRPLSEDLHERRKQGVPPRSLVESLALLAPVASGLAYAHSQRVAHRDVKPGNLFLVDGASLPPARSPSFDGSVSAQGVLSQAGRPMIKILDFGVAKVMEEGATAASAPWTKGGVASFTPYYAAPEQIDPRYGPTGPWTDVYGFALVLAEVLSGKQPVRGPDVVSVVSQVLNSPKRPTPRALGVMIPEAIETAFARAMAIDPKMRFPDVGAFWDALSAAASLGMTARSYDAATSGWVPPQRTAPMPRISAPSGSAPGGSVSSAPGTDVPQTSQADSPRALGIALMTPGVAVQLIDAPSERHRVASGASVQPAPLPVSALTSSSSGRDPEPPPPPVATAASTTPARRRRWVWVVVGLFVLGLVGTAVFFAVDQYSR